MFTDTSLGTPVADPAPGQAPERGGDGPPWFDLAHEAARTGRYRDVGEVEEALRARGESAEPCRNLIARDAIDIACLRARGEEGCV